MRTFEKLRAWQLGHELVLRVYKDTTDFPKQEVYGLTSQIRRSALSVPTNIAEGRARGATKDFVRFLKIARGSLEETEYLLLAARDLGYLPEAQYQSITKLSSELSAILNGLISSLTQNISL